MELEKTQNLVNWLRYLPSIDSTNLELTRLVKLEQLPNFSVLIAGEQTGGQGRLGRNWASESGGSLSASLLLKSSAKIEQLGFLTMIMAVSIDSALKILIPGLDSGVKWPNDVLVSGKKISGILAQLQPDNSLVLGFGLNIKRQLGAPDTATSLDELGVELGLDEVLAKILTQFRARFSIFLQDPPLAIKKTLGELGDVCLTLGTKVRAELPDGTEVIGVASEIDELGRLVILGKNKTTVAAADVWHLRN